MDNFNQENEIIEFPAYGLGNILVVEDDVYIQDLLTIHLHRAGYSLKIVPSAEEAWSILKTHSDKFDTVLLDRNLPGIEGLDLLKKIKADANLCGLPVILETSKGSDEQMLEGLKSGAYYYLPKPIDKDKLLTVINTSVSDYQRYKSLKNEVAQSGQVLCFMESGTFRFQSLLACQQLAISLSVLFPEPEKVILGLSEIMINAVEHGNLEISYAEKSTLLADECWIDEIDKRIEDPHYASRYGTVTIERFSDKIVAKVTDQGQGFDPTSYMEVQLERIHDQHGRGIALANDISFDELTYQDDGRTAVCTVFL